MFKFLENYKLSIAESVTFISFLVFSLFGILQHEMWRDELQAWMLSRDSSSLVELYQNMQYEGHPALWHLLLFILSQLTHDPVIMQIAHWFISVSIAYLILKFSPFPIFQKFLLTFSYFIFFEYTFVSRSYNLAILFAFLFCIFIGQRRTPYFAIFTVLALMANTTAYGFLLSGILFFFLILEKRKDLKKLYTPSRFSVVPVLGLLYLGASWSIAFLYIARAKIDVVLEKVSNSLSQSLLGIHPTVAAIDMGGRFETKILSDSKVLKHVSHAMSSLWNSYIPVPPLFERDFWGRNILEKEYFFQVSGTAEYLLSTKLILSVLIFFICVCLFQRKRNVLWTYLLGNFVFLGFQTVIFKTHSLRHQGFFFLLFIVCVWLYFLNYESDRKFLSAADRKVDSLLFRFFSFTLFLQMIVGIYAGAMDYVYPFSAGKETAEYIAQHDLNDLNILGSRYRQVSIISGYLDVPIYYLELEDWGTFIDAGGAEIITEADLIYEIQQAAYKLAEPEYVLVLNRQLENLEISDLQIVPLATFDGSLIASENFYTYIVSR